MHGSATLSARLAVLSPEVAPKRKEKNREDEVRRPW
jgi:hypothetical protein